MKIKSYLPIFPGFYSTQFEADETNSIEDGYTYDDYTFDYTEFKRRMAMSCIESVERELPRLGFKIKISFDDIYSPREYNFTNDSINCTYSLTEKTRKSLYSFLKTNKEKFAEYLKDRFTSYDGFESFYSNDVNVWLNELDFSDSVVFASILEFVLLESGYTEEEMAQNSSSENYVDATLKEGAKISEEIED